MTERPRGICFHEAGHAVVAWKFRLPVRAVRVSYNDAKGWHGGTDTDAGAADRLPLIKQIAAWAAGYTSEQLFGCEAHEGAARYDRGMIASILMANEIPEQEHPARITEANDRARTVLKEHKSQVFKLVERLVECGHVDAAEFENLMPISDL